MSTTAAELGSFSPTKTSRATYLAPPLAALAYPFLLKGFTAAVGSGGFSLIAFVLLMLAIAVAAVGFAVALRVGQMSEPTSADILGRRIALLSSAAAPIFTAAGVVLYMAGDPISDITFWLVFWGVTCLIGLQAAFGRGSPIQAETAEVSPRLRVAHGFAALSIVLLFLAMHLSNHLMGLLSEAAHRQVMDVFRNVYRAHVVEPLIVALFLFQVVSGLSMLWQYSSRRGDVFRTLQIVTGAYLVFFILGHMNSVFFYARMFANIKTDWNFATGAPTGLIKDAWNIRLVPHYALGVFFVITHLILGARIVGIAHGYSRALLDKWSKGGIAIAAIVTIAIMLGMVGVHLAG